MPERMPTNICFGGQDMRTAYITLSPTGKLAAMLGEAGLECGRPAAGDLDLIAGLQQPGLIRSGWSGRNCSPSRGHQENEMALWVIWPSGT